jgi:hypothetical protein
VRRVRNLGDYDLVYRVLQASSGLFDSAEIDSPGGVAASGSIATIVDFEEEKVTMNITAVPPRSRLQRRKYEYRERVVHFMFLA